MHGRKRGVSRSMRAAMFSSVCALGLSPVYGQTNASWLSAASGTWSDAANWSINPTFPNNGLPTAADEYAVTIAAMGSPYTVTLNTGSITIDSLTLGSANATLLHQSGTLNVSTLNIQSGTYLLASGTIQNATISGAGAFQTGTINGTTSFSTLDSDTLGNSMLLTDATEVTIKNHLTLQNGQITLANTTFGTAFNFNDTATINGTGQIIADGTGSDAHNIIGGNIDGGTITFASGITFRTGARGALFDLRFAGLVNQGTISSQTSGHSITLELGNFTNQGTLIAQNSGTLSILQGNWSNSGTFIVNNGTLVLGGSFTTAGIGNVQRTGGNVWLNGTLNNSGSTLDLQTSTGSLIVGASGVISGGTITSSGTSQLIAGGGTLSGVILDVDTSASGSGLAITNGLTFANGHSINGSVGFSGVDNISGTGAIVFNSPGVINFSQANVNFGPNVTIRTGTAGGVFSVTNNGSLTNQGTISSQTAGMTLNTSSITLQNSGTLQAINGGSLIVSLSNNVAGGQVIAGTNSQVSILGTWNNSGSFIVNGGTLNLGGTFSSTSIGSVQRTGGGVNITGQYTGSLALTDAIGSWGLGSNNFSGGTIKNGTISTTGSAQLIVQGNSESFLDNVTLSGTVSLATGSIGIRNGITLAGGLFMPADLSFTGAQTIGGTGVIQFDGTNPISGTEGLIISDSSLTIGSGVTIRTGSSGGMIEAQSTPIALINQGTISAQTAGKSLRLLDNFTNQGTIVLSGGTLELGGAFTTAGLGTFDYSGGTLLFTGNLDNTNSTLNLSALGGPWTVSKSQFLSTTPSITGGTIITSNSAKITIAAMGTATFNGVQLIGPLDNGGMLTVQNGLTLNAATLAVGVGGSAIVNMFGTQTISGNGEIVFNGFGGSLRPQSGNLTFGSSLTIASGSADGTIGGVFGFLTTNQGTISAETSGHTLVVQDLQNQGVIQALNGGKIFSNGSFANNATLTASSGGIISLNSNWNNAGTLISNGGEVDLGGTFTFATLGTFSRSGGTVNLTGTLNNSTTTLNLDGINGTWRLLGGQINGGTVVTSSGSQLESPGIGTLNGVTLSGVVQIDPGGTINITNGLACNNATIDFIGGNGGATIQTFQTESLTGTATLLFDGTIPSNLIRSSGTFTLGPSVQLLTVAQGGSILGATEFINQGLISSRTNGQTLSISAGTFINQGTLEAINGAVLTIGGNWTNAGSIQSIASSVNLGGTFTTGSIGNFTSSGGTVNLTGVLTNTGNTFDITNLGNLYLRNGTLIGGTITSSNSNQIIATIGSGGTFDGVFCDANITLSSSTLVLKNGFTLNGEQISLSSPGQSATIETIGTQTLGGSGTITFNGTNPSGVTPSTGTLTIAPGITIQTGTRNGVIGSFTNTTVINQGLISARNLPISIVGGFLNQGTVEALGGGTVVLPSTTFNISGFILTGGNWNAYGNSIISMPVSGILTNNANVRLDGGGAAITGFNFLETNLGTFSITGGQTFSPTGSLSNSGEIIIGKNSDLTIHGKFTNTGSVDLNGSLIVDYTGMSSPFNTLVGEIGNHIISSTALTDPTQRIGYLDNNTDVILRLTFGGDANLDGKVDVNDLGALASHWQGSASWSGGDFNHDGTVNVTDLGILASNWQAGVSGGADAISLSQALESFSLPTNVPEPMISLTLFGLLALRRRRS